MMIVLYLDPDFVGLLASVRFELYLLITVIVDSGILCWKRAEITC